MRRIERWAPRSGVLLFLAVAAVPYGAGPFRTPDVWWHLAGGEWMLETGQAPPRTDPFTATAQGRPWLDHSWLAQLAFAAVVRLGGLEALRALKIALIFAVAAGVWAIVHRRNPGAPEWAAALFAGAYFPAQWFHLTARPLLFSHLLFVLFVFLTRARRLPALCAAAMVVWANCHAACFSGIVYLGLWAAGDVADAAVGGEKSKALGRRVLFLGAALGLVAAAPLINPYGAGLYLYPLEIASVSGAFRPQEWLPPDGNPLLWPFWALLILTILSAVRRSTRPKAEALLPLAGFAVLAIGARRHVEFFNILALVSLADIFEKWGRTPFPLRRIRSWAIGTHRRWSLAPFFMVIALLPVAVAPFSPALRPGGRVESLFPREAVDFLLRQGKPLNVFNSHAYGGYVAWRSIQAAAPRLLPFIDGRTGLFPAAVDRDYRTILEAEDGAAMDRLLTQYRIDAVLLFNPEAKPVSQAFEGVPREPSTAALVEALSRSPAWEREYQDDLAIVFMRRKQAHWQDAGGRRAGR